MTINVEVKEPQEKECFCCGRTNGKMVGSPFFFIQHGAEYTTENQPGHEWIFICQWCRDVKTKQKKRGNKA